jgi:hypothetical protein
MKTFQNLQSGLAGVLALSKPGLGVEHVVVVLPSHSLSQSLLNHYVARIPALEHRYLALHPLLWPIESCHMVFVGSADPGPDIIEYYLSLIPSARQDDVRSRFHVVTVTDGSRRSVAEKLLDRPDLIGQIKALVGGRPGYIEPWNVTEHEVAVAVALQMPINGTHPDLRPLAFKSAGRRLIRDAGVPLPFGCEDVRTVDDIVAATEQVRRKRPGCNSVVLKHDDSCAGHGNVVLRLTDDVRAQAEALPDWYLCDFLKGGVVEERISGREFSSPSAQLEITPAGSVSLLATHEQELGGVDEQIYQGCRFPANPAYAAKLGRHALNVGNRLARLGAVGRLSVDFAALLDQDGSWSLYALEVNLRTGGTTHPYASLRYYVPGRYDREAGQWLTEDGESRAYRSTDNMVGNSRLGLSPVAVIQALKDQNLSFDHRTLTGTVLHMLSSLNIDGQVGLTAIGRDANHADHLFDAARRSIHECNSVLLRQNEELISQRPPPF